MLHETETLKTWVLIRRANLIHNLAAFRKRLKKTTSLLTVIKGNAYGHGIKETASILKNTPEVMLGVDSFEEALDARTAAPKNEIMILGYIPEKNMARAIQEKFHISAYDEGTLEIIKKLVERKAVKQEWLRVHLKIETGTNRLGITLAKLKHINLPHIVGLYTHLADAENPASGFYKKQSSALREAEEILRSKNIAPKFIHISNTAAIIQHGELGGNLARLGIGLYGLWPSEELKKIFSHTIELKPVLSWKTRIAQIKEIERGETVGYDRTYKSVGKKRIAILPIGYYDGYDRALSNCGEVLVHGKREKIIGRVCMNMTMVGATKSNPKKNDEIVLIGKSGREEISADELAKKIGTINYEVVSRINPLIPRIIVP